MKVEFTEEEVDLVYNCLYLHGRKNDFGLERKERLYSKKMKLEKLQAEITRLEKVEEDIESGDFIKNLLIKLEDKG